jgi:hypothetical protein
MRFYEKPEVARSFAYLRDVLLSAVNESDKGKAKKLRNNTFRSERGFLRSYRRMTESTLIPALAGRNRALHTDKERRSGRSVSTYRGIHGACRFRTILRLCRQGEIRNS